VLLCLGTMYVERVDWHCQDLVDGYARTFYGGARLHAGFVRPYQAHRWFLFSLIHWSEMRRYAIRAGPGIRPKRYV
jgi:hypothetical protein